MAPSPQPRAPRQRRSRLRGVSSPCSGTRGGLPCPSRRITAGASLDGGLPGGSAAPKRVWMCDWCARVRQKGVAAPLGASFGRKKAHENPPRLAETLLGVGAPAPSPAAIRRSRPLRRPPALWLRHGHADTRRMRALLAIVACLALTSLAVAEIEFHTLQVGTRRGPSCCVEAGQGGLACGSP